jgi:CspA family cold shock protein
MTIGTVKFFNTSKGFGFISPEGGGKDVFVHVTALEASGMRSLNEGQKVSFDIQPDARGAKAVNLKAVKDGSGLNKNGRQERSCRLFVFGIGSYLPEAVGN